MYCRNCGTVVPGNEEYCEACRMEQIIHQSGTPDMTREGRGAAIVSAVLGIAGSMAVSSFEVLSSSRVALIIVALFVSACIVLAVFFGVRGIMAFRRASRLHAERPVASLVCGIVGVASAGLTLWNTLLIYGVFLSQFVQM